VFAPIEEFWEMELNGRADITNAIATRCVMAVSWPIPDVVYGTVLLYDH